MNDERDPPIEAQQFISGVTVVDIGDIRVARGLSRRPHSICPHKQIVYDIHERRLWCKDCERDVEAFDAFTMIVGLFDKANAAIKKRQSALDEAENIMLRSIASKRLDEAWRSRDMVPACPHCANGLFPEDFKHGPNMISKEFALAKSARRIFKAKTVATP